MNFKWLISDSAIGLFPELVTFRFKGRVGNSNPYSKPQIFGSEKIVLYEDTHTCKKERSALLLFSTLCFVEECVGVCLYPAGGLCLIFDSFAKCYVWFYDLDYLESAK